MVKHNQTSTQSNATTTRETRQRSVGKRIVSRIVVVSTLSIAGLFLLSMSAIPPSNLGVRDGQLAKCPDSPNCVSTQATDDEHGMHPIPLSMSSQDALKTIKDTIKAEFSRAKLVGESEHYLRYEFTSLLFRFVDDVEFYIDDSEGFIHFRSASRIGYSDMGTNRKRMERISQLLEKTQTQATSNSKG